MFTLPDLLKGRKWPQVRLNLLDPEELQRMKFDEVLSNVRKAVKFLKETTDYSTKDVENAIDVLRRARNIDKIKVTKEARDNGLAKQYVKIVQSLEVYFTSPDKSKQGAENLEQFLRTFGNYCNRCPDLGIDLAKHGGVDYIVPLLKKLNKEKKNTWLNQRMGGLLSCLYNSIRHGECSVNRSAYRKVGAVAVLKKLLETSSKTQCLLILAYIVDEGESEILGKDKKTVVFLVDLLKKAAKSKDHSVTVDDGDNTTSTYALTEVANGLSHLIINDANKKVVFGSGGVPVINSMLTSGFNAEEQTLAAKMLWSLSFDEAIRKSDAIKDSLKGR